MNRSGLCEASLLSATALLLLASYAAAQTGVGDINGTIVDRSAGAVPNATVHLTNLDTLIVDQASSNNSGFFVFHNVRPGSYSLSVEAQGFKKAEVSSIELTVNQSLTQNITLDVGSVNESIAVTAEAPLLQQSSSELGSVVYEQVIKELPLNGRNFTQLIILTPGANPISTAQGSTGVGFQDAGITGIPGTNFFKPSLHGQQNRSVLYYLDGITNTDYRGSIYGVLPIIDAMSEFKVESHDSTAEYGGVVGGIVDIVSKSGTNQFHGSAWEFLRNNAFDARNPFTDVCNPARCGPNSVAGSPAPPIAYHQNEFGAAGGGPIRKDKTFFYAAYEAWRFEKPTLNTALVPTAAELTGDFSHSFYKNLIYNPASTVCNNGVCTRQPFSGNIIPDSMISKPMQAIIGAYAQAPNASLGGGSINYVEGRVQTDDANSWMLKIDHRITDRQNIFGRLSQMWVSDVQPVTGMQATSPSNYHAYDLGGGYDYAIRPNLILDIRAGGLMKPYVFASPLASAGLGPLASAGFQNLSQYGGLYGQLATPYTTSGFGTELAGASHRGNPSVNWDTGLNWTKGNHDIKFGAEWIYVNRLQTNLYQPFTFADSQTSNLGAANTGNSLASALLGLPNSITAQTPNYSEVYFHAEVLSGYVQDRWKVRRNLTVSLGFRYEYLPKLVPLNNRLSNDFDLFKQQYLIGAKSVAACGTQFINPCIPGGIAEVPFNQNIILTGQQSAGPGAVTDNFGPRIGIAWQMMKDTVLRAGYGLYYDTISARSQYLQNTIEGPTWPWTIGISGLSENIPISGVWPGAAGNPLVPITSLAGAFPNPVVAASPWLTSGYDNDPHYKNARSQQWNVELQRQLSASRVISIAYVGSHDGRLDYTGNANAAPVASPKGTPSASIDTLKLVPFASPNWHYSQSIGIANYEALEAKFQQRLSQGLVTTLSYTWSKSLDNSSGWFAAENGNGGSAVVQNYFTPGQNYGPSAYNIPQLLTWSTSYTPPFGRGERWLNHGFLSWVLGNWETNYLFLARSGQPFTLTVNGDIANITGSNGSTLSGYGRPNLIGSPSSPCTIAGASVSTGSEACFYNPNAFAIPSFSFGNYGRDTLRNAPLYNFDFSLIKDIPLGERRALQLRFEGFNVFNFQILGTPGTTIGQGSAGVISSIASTPRELQMGAKITF